MSLQPYWCWHFCFGLNKCRQNLLLWEIPVYSRIAERSLCIFFADCTDASEEQGRTEPTCTFVVVLLHLKNVFSCFLFQFKGSNSLHFVCLFYGSCVSLSSNTQLCSCLSAVFGFHSTTEIKQTKRNSCSSGGCFRKCVKLCQSCAALAAVV